MCWKEKQKDIKIIPSSTGLSSKNPVHAINQYLAEVHTEATQRGYNFDREKINWDFKPVTLTVTTGQMRYEVKHLLNKLRIRDPERYKELKLKKKLENHSLFRIIEGEIESWEIISQP